MIQAELHHDELHAGNTDALVNGPLRVFTGRRPTPELIFVKTEAMPRSAAVRERRQRIFTEPAVAARNYKVRERARATGRHAPRNERRHDWRRVLRCGAAWKALCSKSGTDCRPCCLGLLRELAPRERHPLQRLACAGAVIHAAGQPANAALYAGVRGRDTASEACLVWFYLKPRPHRRGRARRRYLAADSSTPNC